MRSLLLFGFIGVLMAAEPDHGPFMELVDQAPEVQMALARWRAATLSAPAAAVLPDPRLWAEGMRDDVADGMEIGIEQELPRWGERDAQRRLAGVAVLRARVQLDQARAVIAREVTMSLIRADAARRRAALADAAAARMDTMGTLVEAAIASGGMDDGGASELLRLRTRREQMGLMAADERRMAMDAEDEARTIIGLPADRPLPPLVLPDLAQVDAAADPAKRLADSEQRMAEADHAMARSRRLPMVGVGASWAREDLTEDMESWKVMLSVTIPLQQGALAGAERAAQAQAQAARREVAFAAQRSELLLRRVQRAREQAERARTAVAAAEQRSAAEFTALQERIASGATDGVVRALTRLDELQAAQLAAIAADAEAASMSAELWSLHRYPEP